MDIHRRCLSALCRLCGSQFKNKEKTKSKGTISRDLELCFHINVAEDQEDVHPGEICHSCTLKLSRWRKVKNSRKHAPVPKIDLFNFESHESGCCVCEGSQWDTSEIIQFCKDIGISSWEFEGKVVCVVHDNLGEMVVKRIVFESEVSYTVYIFGKQVRVPDLLPTQLIQFVKQMQLCTGNTAFPDIAEKHEEGLTGANGHLVAEVEDRYFWQGKVLHRPTIRHLKCELIATPSGLCNVCSVYKGTLYAKASHSKKSTGPASKFKRNSYMSNQELRHKVSNLSNSKKLLNQQNAALKKTVVKLFQEESVQLNNEDVGKVSEMVGKCASEIRNIIQDNPNCSLLWEEQCKAHSTSPKQMRWHPAVIKWAIAIHGKSSSAYNLLRDAGFLRLPHPNTLGTYTHFTDPATGINAELLNFYVRDLKLQERPEHERQINLIFDEMKVTSGLAFSMKTGRIIGYVDVGDVVSLMKEFEQRCSKSSGDPHYPDKDTASHVLLFLARSITASYKFPVAYFATRNVCASDLYPTAMECTEALHLMGLTVKTFTSDGASSNRRLYSIMAFEDSGQPTYKTRNCFQQGEETFFICDVPHLLKTTRNNFENSGWNRKTKNLVFRGQNIKWSQVIHLYEWDQGVNRSAPGLQLLPKLTYEHLHLTPSLRMKVKLAVQVLSSSVAKALDSWKKDSLKSTVFFIQTMNKAFDILNISNKIAWQKKRNEDLKPFSSIDDPRFQWLLDDFLGFLKEWREEGEAREGLTKKEKQKLCLSRETMDGFYITVHSFVEVARNLLSMEGTEYVLSDKLNQDPVEEFFSKQRGTGGSHDNPSVEQFGHFMLKNVVAGSRAVASSRANVRLENVSNCLDDEPLPKKKRSNTSL